MVMRSFASFTHNRTLKDDPDLRTKRLWSNLRREIGRVDDVILYQHYTTVLQ